VGGDGVLVLSPVPTEPPHLGNRLRIAEACRVLRDQGARLTLLHYPSDEEWRARLPAAAHGGDATRLGGGLPPAP
jgi:hypothetical protein